MEATVQTARFFREPIARVSTRAAKANASRISTPRRRRPSANAGRVLLFLADLALLNVTYHVTLALRFGTFMPLMGAPRNAAAWSVYLELEYFVIGLWIVIGLWQRLYTKRALTPN